MYVLLDSLISNGKRVKLSRKGSKDFVKVMKLTLPVPIQREKETKRKSS